MIWWWLPPAFHWVDGWSAHHPSCIPLERLHRYIFLCYPSSPCVTSHVLSTFLPKLGQTFNHPCRFLTAWHFCGIHAFKNWPNMCHCGQMLDLRRAICISHLSNSTHHNQHHQFPHYRASTLGLCEKSKIKIKTCAVGFKWEIEFCLIYFLQFFYLSTPSAAKKRFYFLHFLQGKRS